MKPEQTEFVRTFIAMDDLKTDADEHLTIKTRDWAVYLHFKLLSQAPLQFETLDEVIAQVKRQAREEVQHALDVMYADYDWNYDEVEDDDGRVLEHREYAEFLFREAQEKARVNIHREIEEAQARADAAAQALAEAQQALGRLVQQQKLA